MHVSLDRPSVLGCRKVETEILLFRANTVEEDWGAIKLRRNLVLFPIAWLRWSTAEPGLEAPSFPGKCTSFMHRHRVESLHSGYTGREWVKSSLRQANLRYYGLVLIINACLVLELFPAFHLGNRERKPNPAPNTVVEWNHDARTDF